MRILIFRLTWRAEEGFRQCGAARIGSASTGMGVTKQDLDLARGTHLAMMYCSRQIQQQVCGSQWTFGDKVWRFLLMWYFQTDLTLTTETWYGYGKNLGGLFPPVLIKFLITSDWPDFALTDKSESQLCVCVCVCQTHLVWVVEDHHLGHLSCASCRKRVPTGGLHV